VVVVVVLKGVTPLENEPRMLVFEGGDGGGVGEERLLSKTGGVEKEQPPLKMSRVYSFSRVKMLVRILRGNYPRKCA
jgi:hypothetical protein